MAQNLLSITFLLCPPYDIIIWAGQEGTTWGKTFLYSILVFFIVRLVAMVFQIGPAFIFGEVPDGLILFTAMLIPAILYILGPNYIYNKKWFKANKEQPPKNK